MYNLFMETEIGFLEIICDSKYLLEIKAADKIEINNSNDICLLTKKQLEEYFNKKRKKFTIPIKLNGSTFQNKVWKEISKISYGQTISYQNLANQINNPKAVRAVASAVGANKLIVIIPCHRIIGTNNALNGFVLGVNNKIKLLEIENHIILLEKNLVKSKIIKTK